MRSLNGNTPHGLRYFSAFIVFNMGDFVGLQPGLESKATCLLLTGDTNYQVYQKHLILFLKH